MGDASKLKLLRSTYTKALSVLLMESYALAQKLNLEDEFFDTLSLTEGDEFKDKSLSRINNTLNSSKRKAEELGLVKVKVTGQNIGQATFDASTKECDEAQEALSRDILSQKTINSK